MGFAKEIEDFISGYSSMSKIGQDQQTSKIQKEKWDLEKEQLEMQQMEALATDPTAGQKIKKIKVKKVDVEPTAEAPEAYAPDDDDLYPGYAAGGLVAVGTPRATGVFAGFDRRNRGRRPTIFDTFHARSPEGQAIPEEATPPQPNGSPPATDPAAQAMIAHGHTPSTGKAVKAAVDSFSQDAQGRQAVGGREPEVDLMTGNGAATPEEIRAIDQTIDPRGEMDVVTRGRARLSEAYNYWMSKGFPEKAANVAKRILLFDKNQSMTHGIMAGQMIQGGNYKEAAQVLADTYNQNFHDGKTMRQQDNGNGTVQYQFVDEDGNVVQEGTADPKTLATMASQVASGQQFVESTVQAADDEAQREAGNNPDAAAPAAAPAAAVPDAVTPEVTTPAVAPAATAQPAPGADAAAPETTPETTAPAADTAVPEQAGATAPAPAEPSKATEPPKQRERIGVDEATDRYEYYSSVLNMYDNRKEEGELTPEDKQRRSEAAKLARQYRRLSVELSVANADKKYKSKERRDQDKYLRELAANAPEIDYADYSTWQTGRAAAANDKNLRTPTPDELAPVQAAVDGGEDLATMKDFLRQKGINPSGLQ
jgi:hypothetical protein